MESNKSIKNVVLLIFDQCKDQNCQLVNVNKIIEFITPNFDLNSEEANQLRILTLFQLLQAEGKDNDALISEEQFENVLQQWIPLIQCCDGQLMDEHYTDDEAIFSGSVHQRLSRSLTNLRQHIDSEQDHRLSFCHSWLRDNLTNDENAFNKSCDDDNRTNETQSRSMSPHEDPFTFPINVVRSTPIKRKTPIAGNITCLQQPNLRYIKLQHIADPISSYSDSDAMTFNNDVSYVDDESSDNTGSNKEISRSHTRRKRHRSSIVAQSDFDTRDLLSQLKQIKFKNTQLVDINDRLQVQLENAEENLRNLTTKCCNLEKKSKLYNALSEENKQFVLEIDDIRKCLEKEVEYRRCIMSEKIMTESELTMSKEHIQSLVDKLSHLDSGLEERDMMISSLKSMITKQQEFCSKLQELNVEKDEELMKNGKSMKELTEAIKGYEEQINLLTKEKETIQMKFRSLIEKDNHSVNKMESLHDSSIEDICCSDGIDGDHSFRVSTNTEFKPSSTSSPWSIKVELSKQLVDSSGDNPFCEKMFFTDDNCPISDDSDDGSFNMLKELLTVLSSLRMTLAQYKEHLETASITIKSTEHFSDEITLSYISYLDDSINLLAASTEKAARCQNQFNETFEFLMKRISNLKNEKKTLIWKNEQLQVQVVESPNNVGIEVAEKICFLEEELRRERLSGSRKQRMIDDLEQSNDQRWRVGKCSNCGRSSVRFSANSETNIRYLATEALNLERDLYITQKQRIDLRRSFSNVERNTEYNESDSWLKTGRKMSRKSSTSVDELILRMNQADNDSLTKDDDQELLDDRNYYISTDDLSDLPRYRINLAHPPSIDIDKIIENTWLETNTTMDERRASVFAQVSDNPMVYNAPVSDVSSSNNQWTDANKSSSKPPLRTRKSSSSCSSSNDTSDANSIDVLVERKKLTQELENRNFRLQTRSPVPSSLGVPEDLKSITPTVNEEEQVRVWTNSATLTEPDAIKRESRTNSPVSLVDECSATESVTMEPIPFSRRSSSPRRSVNLDVTDSAISAPVTNISKSILPTISIVEVSMNDSSETYQSDPFESNQPDDTKSLRNTSTSNRTATLESDGNSLQASMNRSSMSSRASSVVGEDSKVPWRPRHGGSKKMRRPYTIAGIGIGSNKMIPDDQSSNCDEQSTVDGVNDIQESIDLLQEMKDALTTITIEDLESKFNEVSLIYRTDRPTVIERANDANKKCNKALNNVEQEFNILRHLIKSVAQIIEQPCEFVPRLKASIGVLEKCVEYLSAKSEILGAVEQEVKMSSIVDVMNEYNIRLSKQREEHLRELEEARSWKESAAELASNGSFDQTRPKRGMMAGKDAKTRFQLAAQSTVMKSSIIRQFAASSFSRSGQSPSAVDNNGALESAKPTPFRRGASSQAIDFSDGSMKPFDNETGKIRKFTATKFFPGGGVADETGESLFQKGLHQGMRLSTDQVLSEMRAEQSKFSSTLDSLSDMIEEYDPLMQGEDGQSGGGDYDGHNVDTRIVAIKEKLWSWMTTFSMVVKRCLYLLLGSLVVVALLLPWLLTPDNTDSASFSVPLSRRPIQSLDEHHNQRPRSPSSSSSSTPGSSSPPSSSSFFSNVNVIRHRPAAV